MGAHGHDHANVIFRKLGGFLCPLSLDLQSASSYLQFGFFPDFIQHYFYSCIQILYICTIVECVCISNNVLVVTGFKSPFSILESRDTN